MRGTDDSEKYPKYYAQGLPPGFAPFPSRDRVVQFLPLPVEVVVRQGLAGAGIPVAGIAEVALFAMEVGVYPVGPGIFVLLYDLVGRIPVAFCVQFQGLDEFRLVSIHEKHYTNGSSRCPHFFVFLSVNGTPKQHELQNTGKDGRFGGELQMSF